TPWQFACQVAGHAVPDAPWLRALAAYQDRHAVEGRLPGVVFTSETLGDFLLWQLAPETPLFIYTHVHLFSPEHWQETLQVRSAGPAWRDILKHHRVNVLLIEADMHQQICAALRQEGGWRVLLDESGSPEKRDRRCRLFPAV